MKGADASGVDRDPAGRRRRSTIPVEPSNAAAPGLAVTLGVRPEHFAIAARGAARRARSRWSSISAARRWSMSTSATASWSPSRAAAASTVPVGSKVRLAVATDRGQPVRQGRHGDDAARSRRDYSTATRAPLSDVSRPLPPERQDRGRHRRRAARSGSRPAMRWPRPAPGSIVADIVGDAARRPQPSSKAAGYDADMIELDVTKPDAVRKAAETSTRAWRRRHPGRQCGHRPVGRQRARTSTGVADTPLRRQRVTRPSLATRRSSFASGGDSSA